MLCSDWLQLWSLFPLGVNLRPLATDIAKAFEGIETERPVKVQKVYQC
jgi:hypothetical protein